MRLEKSQNDFSAAFEYSESDFGAPVSVQGGKKRENGNIIFVESGGRYKLFASGCDLVKILTGSGYFKWARGEKPFSAGEVFCAEEIGEYELNGKCSFLVIRES